MKDQPPTVFLVMPANILPKFTIVYNILQFLHIYKSSLYKNFLPSAQFFSKKILTKSKKAFNIYYVARKCRNWQTSKTKDLVAFVPCGFKSHLPHNENLYLIEVQVFCCYEGERNCRIIIKGFPLDNCKICCGCFGLRALRFLRCVQRICILISPFLWSLSKPYKKEATNAASLLYVLNSVYNMGI